MPKNRASRSITVQDASGFIEYGNSVVNSSPVMLNPDGTFTVYFGSKELRGDVPNRLDTPVGWNYMMRVYRPYVLVLGGGYKLPPATAVRRQSVLEVAGRLHPLHHRLHRTGRHQVAAVEHTVDLAERIRC